MVALHLAGCGGGGAQVGCRAHYRNGSFRKGSTAAATL
jgi:hypothetical protein